MLNKIWPAMIIISVIYGFFSGRIKEVNDAIFVSLDDTVTTSISFLGIMCFWSGMIEILKNTTILHRIGNILKPFIEKLFKDESKKAKELITLNVVSNMLGLGNAATPVGIKAMEELNKSEKGKRVSYGMNIFILLNTLSIQIIPTMIISIRASLGSQSAGKIIIPVWIVSILTLIIIMFIGLKIFKKEKDNGYI